MAKNFKSAWGLDIGTDSLKVAHVRRADGHISFESQDYAYHKPLWMKDSHTGVVDDAIGRFMDTQEVAKGEPIVINIPTRFGLMRFFEPPPIAASKIKDIANHEARQQIPFDLEDVVFEVIQTRGECVDGFLMESEFVIVAAKINMVEQRLALFNNFKDLRITQAVLEPFAILTAMEYQHDETGADADTDDVVGVISMGAECSTLMFTRISDGGIVRPMYLADIPIGGVHWTRQLAKELKLTWVKAEHLKRNVAEAEDARAVIQSMRPVYNDFVVEVKRRIEYFMKSNRDSSISKFVVTGDGFLLPGLVAYLEKDIGYPVEKLEPQRFVAFGLALQGLGFGENLNNLMPPRKSIIDNLDLGWVKRMIPRWRNPFVWDR